MADTKKKQRPAETAEERVARENELRRREMHARAQDANPLQAGNELLDGSDERKAKLDEMQEGAKEEPARRVATASGRRDERPVWR